MSLDVIIQNPTLSQKWIEREKKANEAYFREHPDSFLIPFSKNLRDLGFQFETTNQITSFMPKHKTLILPLAQKYYLLARDQRKSNEQDYFLSFFHYKGLDDSVPFLLAEYESPSTPELTRWYLSDSIYSIRSSRYTDDYLKIVQNPAFGQNRQLIVLLLGKMKVEKAIPTLISLLEDETVCLQAIDALGQFKKEEFRSLFIRFENSSHPGWRKYSRIAIQKLDHAAEKKSAAPPKTKSKTEDHGNKH